MNASRIEIFEQILAGDPANTAVLFGLAKEYEKASDDAKLIDTLERYLAAADENDRATLGAALKRQWRTAIPEWQKSTERFWKMRFESGARFESERDPRNHTNYPEIRLSLFRVI